MKKVKMFYLRNCPYCKEALRWMDEVRAETPRFEQVEVELIEERQQAQLADTYDYYYVPAYYVDEEKVHEGAVSKRIVENVFHRAAQ